MTKYINLLRELISTPSPSREEGATADILERFLREEGCSPERIGNNVVVMSHLTGERPVVMLNSHHDTVKPVGSYTRNPYDAEIAGGRIYGLGSNDAGGSVVSLIATFLKFKDEDLPFELILVLSAEEEVSGTGGIGAVLGKIGLVDMAIVGEPTGMNAGIGERGLVVLDCTAHGKAGHAARNEGVNAIYIALNDIERLRQYQPMPVSELLGPVKFTVTQIDAGKQHNVVPDECRFVVDVRTTDALSNEEIVVRVNQLLRSDVIPRSTKLRASALPVDHPLAIAAEAVGIKKFLSPTMSDMAQMPFPTIKIGPGDSARSHTADEYIYISEIENAITTYEAFIRALQNIMKNGQ